MQITWSGANSPHELAIRAAMQAAADDVTALGAIDAHLVCEARRVWLLTQLNTAWLAGRYGAHTGILSPQQAAGELAMPFAPFALPATVTINFVNAPIAGLGANAPMGTWAATHRVDVYAPNISPQLTALSLSVRQLTLHEIIHLAGDAAPTIPIQWDNAPRMNWAGVGAIMRATMQPARAVIVVDGLPPEG